MISDGTYKEYECALSDDLHFIYNPIDLPCGHCVCKSCIPKTEEFICNNCDELIKSKNVYEKLSNAIQLSFNRNLESIYKIIEKQSIKSMEKLKGNFNKI